MIFRLLLAALALAFAAPATAHAYDPAADYERAFEYWSVEGLPAARCPNGPIGTYDQAKVGAYEGVRLDGQAMHGAAELAEQGGCSWWFGDYFATASPTVRCEITAHAVGHLLGRADGIGQSGDPLGVMGSDALTPQCAAVEAPARAAAASAVTAWRAYDEAVAAGRRIARKRDQCTAYANERRVRAARVRARARCRRLLPIRREPDPPAGERPATA